MPHVRVMALLRIVHRWLGLALAAVVCVVAASGGLLLLRDPYYRAVYPTLRTPISAAQIDARAAVLTDIESRWQHEGIQLVKFPRPELNAFQVWLRDGTEAFVDPLTGAVIDRWRWSTSAPAFLFELHAHLLVEPSGTIVNGVASLVLIFMALTGVVLWWPARQNAFRLRGIIPRGTTARELLRSHAAVGAIAALPILVFAVTGAGIVFYEPTARAMSRLFDSRAPEQPDARVAPREEPTRAWSLLLSRLDETFPDGRTVFYYPGNRDNARLLFRKQLPGEWHPNGRSYIVMDPYTTDVVQAVDARAQGAGTRAMHALYPVHAAKVGGPMMVALAALASLALTWLAAGGVWTYASRWIVARSAHRARVEKADRAHAQRSATIT
jgi:uncharacterized iron-regulated membrane protein